MMRMMMRVAVVVMRMMGAAVVGDNLGRMTLEDEESC
jgi:hypothetical protein